MPPSCSRYPLVRLIIPFVGGMVAANFLFPLGSLSPTVVAILACVAGVVVFVTAVTPFGAYPRIYFGLSVVCFSFLFGMFLFLHRRGEADIPADRWLSKTKTETVVQRAMHDDYETAGIDGLSGAVIEAMTTGNKTRLPYELRQSYSKAGVAHILALSGFHLTILLALFDIFLLRGFLPHRGRRLCGLLVIPLLWLYAWMTGMPVSLVRAAAMCSFLQLALMLSVQYDILNSCAVAALLMLLMNPLLILDIGFQLSFVSILGIVTMGIPLYQYWSDHGLMPSRLWLQVPMKWVMGTLCISVACTLFTFPLVSYHFGQIPLFSLISNIVVSLVAIVIMWGACFWWMCFWSDLLQWLIAKLLMGCAGLMNQWTASVAAWPFAVVEYRPTVVETVLLYTVLLSGVGYCHYRTARMVMTCMGAWIAFILFHLLR